PVTGGLRLAEGLCGRVQPPHADAERRIVLRDAAPRIHEYGLRIFERQLQRSVVYLQKSKPSILLGGSLRILKASLMETKTATSLTKKRWRKGIHSKDDIHPLRSQNSIQIPAQTDSNNDFIGNDNQQEPGAVPVNGRTIFENACSLTVNYMLHYRGSGTVLIVVVQVCVANAQIDRQL
ncbi:hypothetical protein PIB30_070876, partial [Stylosanthes scabra]|nr:hypothetical protein [Stylosanthes scabra]